MLRLRALLNVHDLRVHYIRLGIKGESSFEREILDKTNHCQIWGYADGQGGKSFGPEILSGLAHRTHFKPYGIASYDRLGPGYSPNRYKLPNFMKQNGWCHLELMERHKLTYSFFYFSIP